MCKSNRAAIGKRDPGLEKAPPLCRDGAYLLQRLSQGPPRHGAERQLGCSRHLRTSAMEFGTNGRGAFSAAMVRRSSSRHGHGERDSHAKREKDGESEGVTEFQGPLSHRGASHSIIIQTCQASSCSLGRCRTRNLAASQPRSLMMRWKHPPGQMVVTR